MADEIRKDPKGRKLQTGETYDAKTGRYRFSYQDATGKRKQIYSWTLTRHDLVPKDKNQRYGESLREKEDKVRAEIVNAIDSSGGNMSVNQLLERYVNLKSSDVRETTRKGYRTQLKFMQTNSLALWMGKKRIKEVAAMDAEEWMKKLHTDEGRSYSSLHTLKGMLRQAFAKAKTSHWVLDNPFDFSMVKKAYGDQKSRDALSKADAQRFLDFLKIDKHFSRYYDGIFILFNTGLRVSEFCGLTPEDIDFANHKIYVRRQLLRVWDGKENKYYIEEPKTENGKRPVPMLPGVEEAFRNVMKNRPKIKETIVWDELHQNSATGFLWLDKDLNYEVAQHWSNHLRWARKKFNSIYKQELPPVTPHVCRHTFCSICASRGMNPKVLQKIMGHSSIEFTLNVYTHIEIGDLFESFMNIMNNEANMIGVYGTPIKPALNDASDSDDFEEGDADFGEIPDDDDEE